MRFSICIPTYNRDYCVSKAIDSVLSQTYKDFEILVVDDGSTDNTQRILNKYLQNEQVHIFTKSNGGKHTALNLGFENAIGEYFIILDSDDVFTDNCLQILNDALTKANSNPNCCGVLARCGDKNGNLIGEPLRKALEYISYIDFHYRVKENYGDCVEAVKTSLLKQYRFPVGDNFSFVPERYVFDKIGLDYSLYCIDDILKLVDYKLDGITANAKLHLKKNAEGFLIDVIDKIENIFPYTKVSIKSKFKVWVKYWVLFRYVGKVKYKTSRVNIIGIFARIVSILYKF